MLKWPPEQAFRTDVNLILMALDAHGAMLKSIFGSSEEAQPQAKPGGRPQGATVGQYLGFAARHNSRYQGGRRPGKPGKRKGRGGGG